MPIKTILVSLNDVERTGQLMRLAASIAEQHDAHIIGLYVIPAIQIYPAVSMNVTPEIFEAQREYFKKRWGAVRQQFDDWTRREQLRSEWRIVESASPIVADTVIEHGRMADLVLIGQVDPDSDNGVELDFAERIVMEAGRPILIVPHVGNYERVGERVIAGWNGGKEAARALFDSVPLLANSKEVRLVWVDPQKHPGESGNLPGAEMAATLARHGLNAIAEPMPTAGVNAGEALLNRSADLASDLLVMGAYGHSRVREFVFGGATRFVLSHMTLPVLFSH